MKIVYLKTCLLLLFSIIFFTTKSQINADCALKNRWYRNLYTINNQYWAQSTIGLAEAKKWADTAVVHGYNGVVVPMHYFFMGWNPTTKTNFQAFCNYCQSIGLEVIPEVFPINSGGMVFNRNFAEADLDTLPLLLVNDSLRPIPQTNNFIANGDLENYSGNIFSQYLFQDNPGVSTFVDLVDKYQGNSSIRFQNFPVSGMIRLCQNITLKANNHYVCTFWLKKNTFPNTVRFLVTGQTFGNYIQEFKVPTSTLSSTWTQYSFEFSTQESAVRIYAGTWDGSSGQFWLDDIQVKESSSLSNIVRRVGTPLVVKDTSGSITYVEGIDYEAIKNLNAPLPIKRLPGSAITNGQQVTLTCYKASDYDGYKSLCMTHDSIYFYFSNMMHQIHNLYNFKKVFLYIDEIRVAGSCFGCQSSGKSTSEILGDCTSRLRDTLKAIDSLVEVLTWGDMFDPNWNSKNHYYKVVGDLTGSWNYIPTDITIVPWGDPSVIASSKYNFIQSSINHFTTQGFNSIMGAGYYDTGTLTGTASWIKLLFDYSQTKGLIYTTWVFPPDFTKLSEFGNMMNDSINARSTSLTLSSGVGSDAQTVCTATAISSISYSVGGNATGANVIGLPAGVTSSYNAGVLVVSGTPTINGTYNYTATTIGPSCLQSSLTGTLTVNLCTGIEPLRANEIVKLFPNPNLGAFTIQIESANYSEVNITLEDMLGRIVFNEVETKSTYVFKKQINVSYLTNGVYYLKWGGSNKINMEKIIIQR